MYAANQQNTTTSPRDKEYQRGSEATQSLHLGVHFAVKYWGGGHATTSLRRSPRNTADLSAAYPDIPEKPQNAIAYTGADRRAHAKPGGSFCAAHTFHAVPVFPRVSLRRGSRNPLPRVIASEATRPGISGYTVDCFVTSFLAMTECV
jgi:hypothetical protein